MCVEIDDYTLNFFALVKGFFQGAGAEITDHAVDADGYGVERSVRFVVVISKSGGSEGQKCGEGEKKFFHVCLLELLCQVKENAAVEIVSGFD